MVKLITTDSYFELFPILAKLLKPTASDINSRNVVFCEAKVSLMVERKIAESLGGSFNTDVYSFGKFLRVKKPMDNLLSKEGSAMAIKRILKSVPLKCFKSSKDNLAPSLYDLIIQLKSAKVTPEDIDNAKDKTSGVLKNKLEDVAVVYDAYERYIIENGLEDQSSLLSYLPSVIDADEDLKNSHVYLVGYSGFTAQAREAVKSVLKNAKAVTAILTAGENSQVFVNETAEFFVKACRDLGIKLDTINLHSEYTKTGRAIVENAFMPVREGVEKINDGSIYLLKEKTPTHEIERIAECIKDLVMKGEGRYRDVTVALSDVSEYANRIKETFDALDIPYFIDIKRDVSNHPLVTLITSYVDAHRKNLERKTLSEFFKNPLFNQDKNLSDRFENYLIKYNVNYSRINSPFIFEEQREDFSELESMRQNIAEIFKTFNVKTMIEKLCVKEKLSALSAKLKEIGEDDESAVNDQVFDAVMKILDQMQLILGDVKMSLTEYKNVFLSGVNALKISIIPQYNDAVFVGGYRETALAKAKYLFAPGLNIDVPSAKQDVAILSDSDLTALEQIKVLVEPKIKVVNHRIRENVALALGAFSSRLYLSYPIFGVDGNEKQKSELFATINCISEYKPFPEKCLYLTKKQGKKNFALACSQFVERELTDFSIPSAYYKAVGESELKGILDSANKEIKERLDKVDRPLISGETSPTAIEDYFKCPYQAFISHSLRVREREEGEVNALSVGNLMHDIFSIYATELDKITDEKSSDGIFDQAKDIILSREEYGKFLQSKETAATINRILKECRKYCYATYNSFKNSSLKVSKTEVSFGSGANCKYPALSLLDGSVKIKGKIDRVDESNNYYRIIDYKTGGVDDSEKSLFAGIKLQLFLYAAAVSRVESQQNNKGLAGLYYLPVFDRYEKQSDKGAPMAVGFTLSEKAALKEQDKLFEDAGSSDFMPVRLDKSGTLKGGYDRDTLKAYVDYAVTLSESAVKNMKEGVIIPSPYEGVCEYCKFKGVCGAENPNARKPDKVTASTIRESVKGVE